MKASEFSLLLPDENDIRKVKKILARFSDEESLDQENIFDHITSASELFLLSSFMNAQKKSGIIENYIARKMGGELISPSLDRGDMIVTSDHGEVYYEMKTSTTNDKQKLNARQIRLWQDVDYYLCSYIDEKNLHNSRCYVLTKEQMEDEVILIGGFTHGTRKSNVRNENQFHSVTVNMARNTKSKASIRWNNSYRRIDIEDLLFSD